MPPLEGLFFDLDETLLDDNSSYDESISLTCAELRSLAPDFTFDRLFETYKAQSDSYWVEVEQQVLRGVLDGQAVRLEIWRRALTASGCRDESVAKAALNAYSRHRKVTYRLFDDALPLLQSLHGSVPLVLITNGSSDTQWEKVRVTGVAAYLDVVLVSGDVGVAKPDPAIFHLALEKLGVSADGTWHVGDNLKNDVGGAQSAGLRAVWMNRRRVLRTDGEPTPDHEIASLSELLPLLGEA